MVGAGDVAVSGTFLAGITSINILDLHLSGLSLVSKELLKAEATRLKARVSASLLQETKP